MLSRGNYVTLHRQSNANTCAIEFEFVRVGGANPPMVGTTHSFVYSELLCARHRVSSHNILPWQFPRIRQTKHGPGIVTLPCDCS